MNLPTISMSIHCALLKTLLNFAGCALIVSHDRWFLDRIATHILAFEGDSEVVWFEGNYQDYEADKKRRLGVDTLIPNEQVSKVCPNVSTNETDGLRSAEK